MSHTPDRDGHADNTATLTALERARQRVVPWLHTALDAEESARTAARNATGDTAREIHAARAVALPWNAISEELGGINRSTAAERVKRARLTLPPTNTKRRDKWDAARAALRATHAAEHDARRAQEQATDTTAAAIAIARTIGHTWATINDATGMSRQSQLARLNRTYADGARTAVPSPARAADYTRDDHNRQGTQLSGQAAALWRHKQVAEALSRGVATAVRNRLAGLFNTGDGPGLAEAGRVVVAAEDTRQQAIAAAVRALANMHLAGLEATDPAAAMYAAEAAEQASSATGGDPAGDYGGTSTVLKPSDAAETARQLEDH